jgi:hypothetical protein
MSVDGARSGFATLSGSPGSTRPAWSCGHQQQSAHRPSAGGDRRVLPAELEVIALEQQGEPPQSAGLLRPEATGSIPTFTHQGIEIRCADFE